MTFKTGIGALALVVVLAPAATPADHIVSPDAVAERLGAAAADRDRNLSTVRTVFATPEAAAAAATLGVDLQATSARLGGLSDAELADLAARAAAIQEDPVAGALTRQQWMYILIGAAAVLVLILVL
jgi:hypothetical protein